MKPEAHADRVREIFYLANFIRDLEIRLDKFAEGICETSMVVQERMRQQHGFVHGGVLATLADHTAGGAARSVSGEKDVLTVEFKINYSQAGNRRAFALYCDGAARRQNRNRGRGAGVCQQCRERSTGS
jgi:uncharacterized protein (TIGR00369 family)